MTIRLGTWNCNNGCDPHDSPFDFASSDLRKTFDKLDLVFMQEVPFVGRQPDADLVGLLDRAGLAHRACSILDVAHNREEGICSGLLIASRIALGTHKARRFVNPNITAQVDGEDWESHEKGSLAVPVLTPTVNLLAINVHLLPYESFGNLPSDDLPKQAWRELEALVTDSLSDSPRLIVAGDFNRTETQLVKLRSLLRGETTRVSGESHDNVFSSDRIRLGAAKTHRSPSDHFFVLGEATCLR